MIGTVSLKQGLRRALRLLIAAWMAALAAHSAQAATFVITFSGITDTSYYYDPYSDPAITDFGSGPFSTTLSFEFPFAPPAVPGDWPIGYDDYYTDPSLGPVHSFFFPTYNYISDGSRFTLGHRSFDYYFTTSEGSDFSIGVTSLTDLFSTIDQPTAIDIDIGPSTGSSGSFVSRSGYYKEPQFGYSDGRVTHLTISVIPGVPEAGTWAMMIAGFGMMGLACRRPHKGQGIGGLARAI